MDKKRLLKNLEVPNRKIDVVLDTDTYNEVDDQFAIAYMLKSEEKICVKAIYAAPFFGNGMSDSPEDGMYKSYDEIQKILGIMGRDSLKKSVFHGAIEYMKDEETPVLSEAVYDLVERAKGYSPENPLYVVGIAAITDIASAILFAPEIKDNIVVVWLGGSALHYGSNNEFNIRQDVAAARVVFGCGVPLIQLPCEGVVSSFAISGPEIETWMKNKNPICDYLAEHVFCVQKKASHKTWSRIIWDVTAIAWLINDNDRFMYSKIIHSPIPQYDNTYKLSDDRQPIRYVNFIKRDALLEDLLEKLTCRE